METEAPVDADDEEIEVVAQSDACARGQLAGQAGETGAGIGEGRVPLVDGLLLGGGEAVGLVDGHVCAAPHVAGIEEEGSVEAGEEAAAILEVEHQLRVAVLHEIGHLAVAQSGKGAGADAAHGEGSEAVGTAHVEAFAEGVADGVAVVPHDAGVEVSHEL